MVSTAEDYHASKLQRPLLEENHLWVDIDEHIKTDDKICESLDTLSSIMPHTDYSEKAAEFIEAYQSQKDAVCYLSKGADTKKHTPEMYHYHCSKCNAILPSDSQVYMQTKTHKPNKLYKCPKCPSSFFAEYTMQKHYVDVHSRLPYACDECGLTWELAKSYFKHRKDTHNDQTPYRELVQESIRNKFFKGCLGLEGNDRLKGNVLSNSNSSSNVMIKASTKLEKDSNITNDNTDREDTNSQFDKHGLKQLSPIYKCPNCLSFFFSGSEYHSDCTTAKTENYLACSEDRPRKIVCFLMECFTVKEGRNSKHKEEKEISDFLHLYKCPSCPRKFRKPTTMHTHYVNFHSYMPLKCRECGLQLFGMDELISHRQEFHLFHDRAKDSYAKDIRNKSDEESVCRVNRRGPYRKGNKEKLVTKASGARVFILDDIEGQNKTLITNPCTVQIDDLNTNFNSNNSSNNSFGHTVTKQSEPCTQQSRTSHRPIQIDLTTDNDDSLASTSEILASIYSLNYRNTQQSLSLDKVGSPSVELGQHTIHIPAPVNNRGNSDKYVCSVCRKVFLDYSTFETHHHNDDNVKKLFHCPKCFSAFFSDHIMQKHYVSSHCHLFFPCEDCDMIFDHAKKYGFHRKETHQDTRTLSELYQAAVRHKFSEVIQFASKEQHYIRHDDSGNSDSVILDTNSTNLKSDMAISVPSPTFPNYSNDQAFLISGTHDESRNDTRVLQHIPSNSSEELKSVRNISMCNSGNTYLIKCPKCPSSFLSEISMQKHYVNVHSYVPYSCDDCAMSFQRAKEFTQHRKKVHSDFRRYKELSETSIRKRFLGNISSGNNEEKSTDSRMTADEKSLETHTSILLTPMSDEEINVPCPFCEQGFHSEADFDPHLQSHYENNPLIKCPKCSSSFLSTYAFERHYLEVHRFVPYICHDCPEQFQKFSKFKDHRKAVHKDSAPFRDLFHTYMHKRFLLSLSLNKLKIQKTPSLENRDYREKVV